MHVHEMSISEPRGRCFRASRRTSALGSEGHASSAEEAEVVEGQEVGSGGAEDDPSAV